METPPKKDKQASNDSGLLYPVLYWGSLFGLFFISKEISKTDEELAKIVFFIGIGIWFLWPLIASIVGKDLSETKENITGFYHLGKLVLGGLLVMVFIGLLLPSSCTSDGSYESMPYYRK